MDNNTPGAKPVSDQTKSNPHPRESADAKDLTLLCRAFTGIAVLGLGGVLLYAIATSTDSSKPFWVLGAAVLIAGVHALAGGIIGFLFAIPRSRQLEQAARPQNEDKKGDDRSAGNRRPSDYGANTNLEQISDWLTKILIGAGLVQLTEIRNQIGTLATLLAPALGGAPAALPVVLCLMGFAVLWGFFFAYLLTRLWLPKALGRAERDEEIQKLEVEREAELLSLQRRAYDFLYESPPGGYSRAIEAIESYLGKAGATPSSWLYVHLACAYGQKHADEKKPKDSAGEVEIRAKVLNAVEQAINLSPSQKDLLTRLYEGKDPNENDLVSLKPDEQLERLLGYP